LYATLWAKCAALLGIRSPGNAVAGFTLRNIANTAEAKITMDRFMFSPFSLQLDTLCIAGIRPVLQKLRVVRLLTLTLSSNEEEREVELHFVRDSRVPSQFFSSPFLKGRGPR